MAHFFTEVGGDKIKIIKQPNGTAGILGDPSGMWCHIRGWNIGVRVILVHKNGRDIVKVYKTHGSNGGQEELVDIYSVEEQDLGE